MNIAYQAYSNIIKDNWMCSRKRGRIYPSRSHLLSVDCLDSLKKGYAVMSYLTYLDPIWFSQNIDNINTVA